MPKTELGVHPTAHSPHCTVPSSLTVPKPLLSDRYTHTSTDWITILLTRTLATTVILKWYAPGPPNLFPTCKWHETGLDNSKVQPLTTRPSCLVIYIGSGINIIYNPIINLVGRNSIRSQTERTRLDIPVITAGHKPSICYFCNTTALGRPPRHVEIPSELALF